jgi:threonine/homoserine/homoserine lactone efflux protein
MILINGLKFGFFMQLAIGPLALMVLNTSSQNGYIDGLILMAGIIVIDMLYMFLACIGISKLLQKNKLQNILKIVGAIILLIFGINNIISFFELSILPKMYIEKYAYTNMFFDGVILTASNPLTIIFLSGIFTSRIMEKIILKGMYLYSPADV